jgi:hypothetical protein
MFLFFVFLIPLFFILIPLFFILILILLYFKQSM